MQSIDSQNITYSLPSHTSRRKLKPQRDNEGILQPEKDVDMSHPSQGLYQYPTQIDVSRGSVDPLALDPSLLHLPTYYRGDKERELDLAMPSNRKSKKAFKPAPPPVPPARSSASILSDARSECLLLAARKFGRMKAGIVSGIVKEREVAKVKDTNVEATTKRRTRDRKDRHREKTRVSEPQHQLHHSLPPPHLPHHLNAIHQPTVGPSTFPITNYYTHPPPPPPPLPATPHRDSPSNAAHPAHAHSLPTHLHPSMTHGQPQPGSIVYLNPAAMQSSPVPVQMQMRTSAGVSVLVPIGPGVWPMPSTPAPPARRHSSKPLAHPNAGPSNQPIPPNENENDQRSSSQSEPDQEPQTPATPLDSLLNAARTLMIDEDDGSEANPQSSEDNATPRPGASTGRRRRRRAVPPADVQDSPIPKRRKMGVAPLAPAAILGTPERSGPRQGPLPVGGTPLQGRVRSALDVLADQAAQEHERRPSVDPGSQRVTPEEDTRPHTESQTNGKATTIRNHEDLSSHIPLGTVRNKGKGRAVLLEPIPLPESRPRSLSAVTRPPVRALPRQIEEPSTRDRRSPFSPLGGPLPSEQSVVPPRERPPDGRGLSVPRDKVPSQHALAIGLARQNTPVAPPSSTSPDGVPSHASSAIIDGEHRGPNSRGPIDSRAPHEMRGSDAKVPGNLTEESLATQSKTTDEASL